MNGQSLRAIRAWVRLDAAFRAFNHTLRRDLGVTGTQLAVLRILAESSPCPLRELRRQLILHPATLGQAVEALVERRLCTVSTSVDDARARKVRITASGRALLKRAPLAGPVRLRMVEVDSLRAERLAAAFDDALELFGLEPWATAPKNRMKDEAMSTPVENAPNIGKELGRRLREVGITTRAELERVGDKKAFAKLVARFPEDACAHTRLALAGAVRGVRWTKLPLETRNALRNEVA